MNSEIDGSLDNRWIVRLGVKEQRLRQDGEVRNAADDEL